MIPGIVDRVFEVKRARRKIFPCHTNRASALGHPCERYLVYLRTRYQEATLPDVGLQFIFDGGEMIERIAIDQLKDAGFVVMQQQRPLDCPEFRELNITGHLDLMIGDYKDSSTFFPCEIKGLNQFDWEKIESIEDLTRSKKPWLRKYPAQLYLYMLMTNTDEGLFYLVNKQNFQPKAIWAPLDYGYTEELLQRASRINRHVLDDTIPDRLEYEPTVCDRCEFAMICAPGRDYGPGVRIVDDAKLAVKLARREELKPLAKEYDAIDEEIKAAFKDIPEALCGDFIVKGKLVEYAASTKPAGSYWRCTVKKL
ncbi:hypothetical protein C4571_01995 [Candidatus Parcubacteria bacterium]|nr:MAG: hypothetical protein C4571_01995 [Candidatus Parcubacteria bacterium]